MNYIGRYGYIALLLASQRGHPKSVEMLITAGADVNSKSELNCTPLFTGAQGVEIYTCVKVLSGANILINEVSDHMLLNALGHVLRTCHQKDINYHAAKLLYAAGETLAYVREQDIPDCLKFEDSIFQLKHICREAIRKHLLELDPHHHLLGRIPKLNLPSALSRYLLFNESLDDDEFDETVDAGDNDDNEN